MNIDKESYSQWAMKKDNERMLNAIREYRANLNDPLPRWPDMEFDRVSYSRWAADEILEAVMNNQDKTAIRVVEELGATFLDYSCISSEWCEVNFIFEIAKDVADDILEILYAMS